MLNRIKTALDPAGIMNPRVLAVTAGIHLTSPFGPLVAHRQPPGRARARWTRRCPQVESVLRNAGLGYRIVRTDPSRPRHRGRPPRPAQRRALPGRGRRRRNRPRGGQRDDHRRPAGRAGRRARGGGGRVRLRLRAVVRPAGRRGAGRRAPGRGRASARIDVGTVTCTCGGRRRPGTSSTSPRSAWAARWWPGPPGCGRFLGGARYAGGFWLTLPGFRPATVRLDADGQAFAWRAFNVVVANCRFYGGGMQISPNSDPDDGAARRARHDRTEVRLLHHAAQGLPGRAPAAPQHRRTAGRPAARRGGPGPSRSRRTGRCWARRPPTFGIIPGAIRLKV